MFLSNSEEFFAGTGLGHELPFLVGKRRRVLPALEAVAVKVRRRRVDRAQLERPVAALGGRARRVRARRHRHAGEARELFEERRAIGAHRDGAREEVEAPAGLDEGAERLEEAGERGVDREVGQVDGAAREGREQAELARRTVVEQADGGEAAALGQRRDQVVACFSRNDVTERRKYWLAKVVEQPFDCKSDMTCENSGEQFSKNTKVLKVQYYDNIGKAATHDRTFHESDSRIYTIDART